MQKFCCAECLLTRTGPSGARNTWRPAAFHVPNFILPQHAPKIKGFPPIFPNMSNNIRRGGPLRPPFLRAPVLTTDAHRRGRRPRRPVLRAHRTPAHPPNRRKETPDHSGVSHVCAGVGWPWGGYCGGAWPVPAWGSGPGPASWDGSALNNRRTESLGRRGERLVLSLRPQVVRRKHNYGAESRTQHRIFIRNTWPLQKRGKMGIIGPWCSRNNCCAECYSHSYRAAGCREHPAACRFLCFRPYFTPSSSKMQGLFRQLSKKVVP